MPGNPRVAALRKAGFGALRRFAMVTGKFIHLRAIPEKALWMVVRHLGGPLDLDSRATARFAPGWPSLGWKDPHGWQVRG